MRSLEKDRKKHYWVIHCSIPRPALLILEVPTVYKRITTYRCQMPIPGNQLQKQIEGTE